MKHILPVLAAAAIAASSCASKKAQETPPVVAAPQGPAINGSVAALPRAAVYTMTGNYSRNIPVQLDRDGNIISFPAPSDVEGQQPIALANGWWLDCRGVSANSVFTTYTYDEYAKLGSTPALAQIKASIIPGARVKEIRVLSMTPEQAKADTAAINAIIRAF